MRDRIDLTGVSDVTITLDIDSVHLPDLLPSSSDDEELKSNFIILLCRILKKYMPYFKKFASGVGHIKHEYYSEMPQKSEVVSSYVYL